MVVQTTLLKKASLVGAFFVSVCLQSAAWAFCPLQPELQALRVAKVVDGDTLRLADGRKAHPSAAIIDSRTIQSTPSSTGTGYDGAKRKKGVKVHMAVDTLGHLLTFPQVESYER